MAAIKTLPMASTDTSPVRYHVSSAFGNHVQLTQIGSTLFIGDKANSVALSQQNAADLATAISNFGSTGTLS